MAPAKLFGLILIQPKLLGPKTIIVCVLVYAVQIATGKKSSKKSKTSAHFRKRLDVSWVILGRLIFLYSWELDGIWITW
jgi:hypothetical protein